MRKIKLTDYIAEYLNQRNIKTVFGVTGGASIHLMHSIASTNGMSMIPCHHEQAAAMAADGYARSTGHIGCAIATSGPGATNLMTGIAAAWFDSIPVLFLTGQVATFRMKKDLAIRQLGFQETDIVSMVKGITKYSIQLDSPQNITKVLDNAFDEMLSGRRGPALIDIPDDLQRIYIDEKQISIYKGVIPENVIYRDFANEHDNLIELIKNSHKPVVIFGAGVNNSASRHLCDELISLNTFPILTTWGAKDTVPAANELNCGTFGTHGTRVGNFIIQDADLVIVIGSRLSTKETGTPVSDWARKARLVLVDIDEAEIEKFEKLERKVDLKFEIPSNIFLESFLKNLKKLTSSDLEFESWINNIQKLKLMFNPIEIEHLVPQNFQNLSPVDFVNFVELFLNSKTDLFVDTGCAVAWVMQGMKISQKARVFHDYNYTAMGWALPAAIGASFNDREVICIAGDGSLMMNIQELATLKNSNRNIKLIIVDNAGYAMVRQTEMQWLNGTHVGTDVKSSDLSFPNFSSLLDSFQINSIEIDKNNFINSEEIINSGLYDGFILKVDPVYGVYPQAKFGLPIEDSEPFLDRTLFTEVTSINDSY